MCFIDIDIHILIITINTCQRQINIPCCWFFSMLADSAKCHVGRIQALPESRNVTKKQILTLSLIALGSLANRDNPDTANIFILPILLMCLSCISVHIAYVTLSFMCLYHLCPYFLSPYCLYVDIMYVLILLVCPNHSQIQIVYVHNTCSYWLHAHITYKMRDNYVPFISANMMCDLLEINCFWLWLWLWLWSPYYLCP